VEVINSLRGPGKAELRHDNFMAKVRNHPGIAQQNFLSGYLDPNGQQRPCYYLPKREAELMVNWPRLRPGPYGIAGTIPLLRSAPDWKGRQAHLSHGQDRMIVSGNLAKIYQTHC